jgi:alpha/beta superfamily hydrolase
MVAPGQFLERSVAIPTGSGLVIDGLYHRGVRGPACVIAAPHPALGGSMTVPAINELAWALTRAGHPTLRFDYRGVGASQGQSRHKGALLEEWSGGLPRIEPGALADEVADLRAAGAQLAETAADTLPPEPAARGGAVNESVTADGARLCAIGYSFGACVVLAAAADPRWERLVLVAPPTQLSDFAALAAVKKPVLIVCAQRDPLCDRQALQKLVEPLGELARLEVIPHADHGFRRGAVELGRGVAEWLRAGRPRLASPRPEVDGEGDGEVVELELDEGEGPPLELDDGE